MIQKLSRLIQAGFYCLAGINHFIDPAFYLDLIPPYFSYQDLINVLAGVVEVLLGLGLLFTQSKRLSSVGIIVMLIAFIPSHIYFIQIGSCVEGGMCVPAWVGWARLLVVHPLLILWARSAKK